VALPGQASLLLDVPLELYLLRFFGVIGRDLGAIQSISHDAASETIQTLRICRGGIRIGVLCETGMISHIVQGALPASCTNPITLTIGVPQMPERRPPTCDPYVKISPLAFLFVVRQDRGVDDHDDARDRDQTEDSGGTRTASARSGFPKPTGRTGMPRRSMTAGPERIGI
jgi:hypothetical protein